MWKLWISSESYVYCKKCIGYVSHSRISEQQNYHEKLGNLVSGCSLCAFWDPFSGDVSLESYDLVQN